MLAVNNLKLLVDFMLEPLLVDMKSQEVANDSLRDNVSYSGSLPQRDLAGKTQGLVTCLPQREDTGVNAMALQQQCRRLLDELEQFQEYLRAVKKGDRVELRTFKNGLQAELKILDKARPFNYRWYTFTKTDNNIASTCRPSQSQDWSRSKIVQPSFVCICLEHRQNVQEYCCCRQEVLLEP